MEYTETNATWCHLLKLNSQKQSGEMVTRGCLGREGGEALYIKG